DVYPLDGRHDGGYYTVKDCVTIDVLPRTPGNNVYVGFMVWSNFTATKCRGLVSLNQVIKERIAKPLRDFIVEASSNLEHSSLIPFFLGQLYSSRISLRGRSAASLRQNCVTVFSFSKNHFSSPSGRWSIVLLISSWGSTL